MSRIMNVKVRNMPGFIIEVSIGPSYINFWNWTFSFSLVVILCFRYLLLWASHCFSEFRFLELFKMLSHFGLYKYFSFRLTRKPYPKYFTRFWICFEFWICQSYIGFCRNSSIINVWQNFEYSLGSQYVKDGICKGCEYAKVTQNSVLKIHLECLEFWIC